MHLKPLLVRQVRNLKVSDASQKLYWRRSDQPAELHDEKPPSPEAAPVTGPVLGPQQPPLETTGQALEQTESVSRDLVRDLTLPPVPNLDIPPSPPGSPDPTAQKKISHFLALKDQGVHFNEKLAASTSLKNPSLFFKLREHAGIDDREQYASSLPSDIWDASSLPNWAYHEELYKSQQATRAQLDEKRAAEGRDRKIEFVPPKTSRTRRFRIANQRTNDEE